MSPPDVPGCASSLGRGELARAPRQRDGDLRGAFRAARTHRDAARAGGGDRLPDRIDFRVIGRNQAHSSTLNRPKMDSTETASRTFSMKIDQSLCSVDGT